MRSGRGRGKVGSSCSVREQEVPARLHAVLGRQGSARGRRAAWVCKGGRVSSKKPSQSSQAPVDIAPPAPIPRVPAPSTRGDRLQAGRGTRAAALGPYLGTLGLIAAAPLGAAGAAAAGPGAGAAGAAATVPSFHVPFSNVIL